MGEVNCITRYLHTLPILVFDHLADLSLLYLLSDLLAQFTTAEHTIFSSVQPIAHSSPKFTMLGIVQVT